MAHFRSSTTAGHRCRHARGGVGPPRAALTIWACQVLVAAAANDPAGSAAAVGGGAGADSAAEKPAAAGTPLRVVARAAVPIYQEPSSAAVQVRAATPLELFVVLATHGEPAAQDRFYQVARTAPDGPAVGWLAAADVVPWGHRILLGRTRPGGPPAVFYQDRPHLQATYAGAPEGVPPLGREEPAAGVRVLLPVLAAEEFLWQGDTVQGFRVACVQPPPAAGPSAQAGPDGAPRRGPRPCDIVFVIDTTSGNASLVEAVRQAVAHVAAGADRLAAPPTRFGLVGFRDVVEPKRRDWYVTRLFCDLDVGRDARRFDDAAAAMEVAEEVPDDAPEDVLAALKLAVAGVKWEPQAFKHLLLLGDAAAQTGASGAKNPDRLTIEQITQLAQPRGRARVGDKITMHALLRGSDSAAVEHFRRLAAGEDFIGWCGTFAGPASVEHFLQAVLGAARDAAAAATPAGMRAPTVLTIVGREGQPSEQRLPFREGFAAECDAQGAAVLEPYVLVSEEQLGMYVSFFDFAIKQMRALPADRTSREFHIVQPLQMLTTSLLCGEPHRSALPAEHFAERLERLPVRSRIMELTPERLAAMSENEMTTWLNELETRVQGLQQRLADAGGWFWWDGSGPAAQKHGFVPLADLP